MDTKIVEFEQMIDRGCVIDVHKSLLVATIRGFGIKEETREYRAFTEDIESLHKWLQENKITHIAMESTGVYWKPVFNILESDFEIILVNARHIKNVPGHKTDKKDSRWIAKLLLSGLLKGSFIPKQPIRELRDMTRYRRKVVEQISSEKNRIQKILEDGNIKLSSVVSNMSGSVATKIIEDLIAGKKDITKLVSYRHGKMQASETDLANELELDRELLSTIPGVGKEGAEYIIAEIGNDMSVFEDEQHLSSWAGMSPGNNESAGKKKRTHNLWR